MAAEKGVVRCFCPACRDGYGKAGADPGELAASVRRALDPVWQGAVPPDTSIDRLIGPGLATATLDFRAHTARTLQESAIAAVRTAAPEAFQVLLHAAGHRESVRRPDAPPAARSAQGREPGIGRCDPCRRQARPEAGCGRPGTARRIRPDQ
ncbi:hypothetical protein [Streptomyces sp. NBC_00390]|uniref:hypothetical protein n=1 Tax=Streptomyces sp. NBC_00390 TaxID=2975736 RepID=UPI002E1D7EA4